MSFFHHPSGVGKLRVGDVVASMTERTDIHLSYSIAIDLDLKFAICDRNVEVPCLGSKKTVCNLKTLEYLARLVCFCVTCSVDVYESVLSV